MTEPTSHDSRGSRWRGVVRLLPSLIATALVALSFGLAVSRTVALEMETHPPVWVVNAIPPVLSELYFGHTKRYTSLTAVSARFFGSLPERGISDRSIDLAIRKVREMNRSSVGSELELMGPDDKGIVDLVKLSFLLFGPRTTSVMVGYYAILLTSCLVYLAAFWRSPSRLLLLAAILALLYLVLPMVAYNAQLRSILALRALPVLSLVACLHCLLFMIGGSVRGRFGVVQVGLVAVQIAVIAFTIHLRSTTIWQVATIVGLGVMVLAVARVRRRLRPALLPVGATVALTVAAYLGVQKYHALALPEEYRRGDEIATRVFWHNIFSGLAFQPAFRERYQLRIDDNSEMAAAGVFLTETGRASLWHEIGGDKPGFIGINNTRYDQVVREMLIARCSTYLRECAEAMLFYKPVSLVGDLAWLYGLRALPPDLEMVVSLRTGVPDPEVKDQYISATQQMDAHGQRAYLWTPLVLLAILPFGVLLAFESADSIRAALAGAVGLALGSLIPTVIGYPLPHTILEPAIAFGMLLYLALCWTAAAGALLLLRLRGRGQPRAMLAAGRRSAAA